MFLFVTEIKKERGAQEIGKSKKLLVTHQSKSGEYFNLPPGQQHNKVKDGQNCKDQHKSNSNVLNWCTNVWIPCKNRHEEKGKMWQ